MAGKHILIADADQKTLLRLEDALGDLDVRVSIAADGAQALERALSLRQDLLLFAETLPIIDTPKLVEILRNNPKTAGVPLVLLQSSDKAPALGDGVLKKPVQADDVVDAVLRFAFHVGNAAEGRDKLSGSLGEMPLADLLQIMRANRREGVLEIDGPTAGTIWLRKGEVIDARAGKTQGLKALFRLLRVVDGRFVFRPSRIMRQPALSQGGEDMPLDSLLLEAARQHDELERMRRERPISGRMTVLRELGALPEGLHPLHRELLLLVEFYGNAEDVVENAKVPDLDAMQALRTLIEGGLIGVGGETTSATQGLRIEPALVVRLKQLAGHTVRRPRPLRVAVFVSAAEIISEFAVGLQPSRWFKHQDRVLGNRVRYSLDGEFSLDIDFYPPGETFSSLVELPPGMLCGGLVIAGETDDKELDFLNDSARAVLGRGLPVEYLFYGGTQANADWVRKVFDLEGDAAVHHVQRDDSEPLLEAVRALVMRHAVASGWTVAAR